LTACNSNKDRDIHSISEITIPDEVWVCAGRPIKPIKVINPTTGIMVYKESDAAFFLDATEEARANCETKLHAARDIYKRQKDAAAKKKMIDTKPK